jgi:hypothetical protein
MIKISIKIFNNLAFKFKLNFNIIVIICNLDFQCKPKAIVIVLPLAEVMSIMKINQYQIYVWI